MTEWIEKSSLAIAILPIGNRVDDLCTGFFCAHHDCMHVVDEQADDDAGGFCRFRTHLILGGNFFVDVEYGSVDLQFCHVDAAIIVFKKPELFSAEDFFIELDRRGYDLNDELGSEEGIHS